MMHKVTRTSEPDSLRQNKAQWTQELLDEIKRCKGKYKDVSDTYKNRYRQQDVKDSLETMFSNLCCFCETKIGASGFERIEHLKPKSLTRFHHLCFEWENLNWSCEICNSSKSNHWDDLNPILDPSVDDVTIHLKFCYDMLDSLTLRGRTTIDHCQLNRANLVKARAAILSIAMRMIAKTNQEGDNFKKKSLCDELYLMAADGEEYCSFINYLIKDFLAAG